jgi:hypothetical protein
MLYKKISLEVIVVANEAESVVAELNAALDRLEESQTLFDGGIETVAFEHPGNEGSRRLHTRSPPVRPSLVLSRLHVTV